MPKRIVRLAAMVLALLILAAPLVGIYLFLRGRAQAPVATSAAEVEVDFKAQGLERTLLGIYLGLRDATFVALPATTRRPSSSPSSRETTPRPLAATSRQRG